MVVEAIKATQSAVTPPTELPIELPTERMELMFDLSSPTLHPHGDRVVVAVTRPDIASNRYVGQLWSVPLDDKEPSMLTRGHRDGAPKFSPDGRFLAFLRSHDGKPSQLKVIIADGGEPVTLTDNPLGVAEFSWSPDNAAIAFVARVPEPARYGTGEADANSEDARLITDLKYLEDGLGYAHDRATQVFVVAVPDPSTEPVESEPPEPTQVTDHPAGSRSVSWSPDGSRLAFVSARHEGRLTDMFCDVWTCAPDGSDLVQVTPTTLAAESVKWSNDGRALYFVATDPGSNGLDYVARHHGLFSVDTDGSTEPLRLTVAESIDLGEGGSHLTVTASEVLVQNRRRGSVELLQVREDSELEVILDGHLWVSGHDALGSGADKIVVASVTSPDSPGEVVVISGGEVRQLTRFATPLIAAFSPLHVAHEFTIDAADGYPVHGWVVLPEGAGPHPVLLSIHGGPFNQHGWRYSGEIQALAAAGYAVVLVNPRGSAGYGQSHGNCIAGGLGDLDASDILDFLDGVLPKTELNLDADRVGIMGGSYGGFMTAWIIAQPRSVDRFVAAIVERGFLDPESFADLSDIGWFYIDALVGSDPERQRAQSPMAFVGNVRTPTFVIHSERDYRCPLEQGQRYFAKLLKQGVSAQFLVFPGERHGLTVFGQPRHRLQRINAILDWWARYLPTPNNRMSDAELVDPGGE